MIDLERARAHLRYKQSNLSVARYNFGHGYLEDRHLRKFEDCVLAALSWCWEEQVKVCGCLHCEGQCCDYVAPQ